MTKLPYSQLVLWQKYLQQRCLWQRSLLWKYPTRCITVPRWTEMTLVALMCIVIQMHVLRAHTACIHTHTYTPPPGPLILSNHSNLNPLNVMIIIIIIITLGNSGNSTSSFNSQLGVQEQRRHALYDSGPGNSSSREGARRTRKAHERKRWRGYGTDSKKVLLSCCPWGESLAHLSRWDGLRFNNPWGWPPTRCFHLNSETRALWNCPLYAQITWLQDLIVCEIFHPGPVVQDNPVKFKSKAPYIVQTGSAL